MRTKQNTILNIMVLALLTLPLAAWAKDDDKSDQDEAKAKAQSKSDVQVVEKEITVGLYYLDDPSYRYGKFTGLEDDGAYALADFRIQKRPVWNSGDTKRWRVQGWRLGLDSRRIEFDFNDQGTQRFKADYREIPNYRFSDGQTPYRGAGTDTLVLDSNWAIADGSSNTRGFIALDETLANLAIDAKRRRLDLSYDRKLGKTWNLDIDYKHETKKGEKPFGGIFGYTGGNPRAVILPYPIDFTIDNIEGMFEYGTHRAQFGFGVYASFFSNDNTSLTWQNAYGRQSQWAESVHFPDAQGSLATEPDNSYVQFKAHGAINFSGSTRLSASASYGTMKQNEAFMPYTVNPNLEVHTPVPLANLDGKINMTMFNIRLTSQLARHLNLALNYNYDDRDNKTPRAVYPYIGADSQNQRAFEDGRINLPYSYRKQKADAIATMRVGHGIRIKGGIEYFDYKRDYQEVANSDELGWVLGIRFNGLETAAFQFDFRQSSRDIDEYIGNTPLLESHLPGVVDEDDWENHPLLRKYFETDRERN